MDLISIFSTFGGPDGVNITGEVIVAAFHSLSTETHSGQQLADAPRILAYHPIT